MTKAHGVANTGYGRIAILSWIFTEAFKGAQVPVRVDRDNIRKGAAPVDPKLPAAFHKSPLALCVGQKNL